MATLEQSLDRFRTLVNSHPRMKTLLKGWDRITVVHAGDSGKEYTMHFKDSQLVSLTAGADLASASIVLRASEKVLVDIFSGSLNPAAEFLDGRLQLTASDSDQVKLDAISLVLWD
jgi:SCP-2 sterol transfer family